MRVAYSCLCLLFSASIFAQDTPVKSTQFKSREPVANSNVPLPVKKVVLYKNGVGYFEHRGQVRGSQEFGIEFTTAQLILVRGSCDTSRVLQQKRGNHRENERLRRTDPKPDVGT